MAAIQLTNPAGGPAAIETTEIILIFFSPNLSPTSAKSNVVLGDSIRSFKNTRQQVAQLAAPSVRLVQLTMPDAGHGNAKGEIWLNADLIIGDAEAVQSGGSLVTMKRRKGPIHVTESKAVADAAIAAAKALPLVV